mmetsp:Transcript_70772/g.219536  ORF Transcript_70772/g.219536 Transcript_70772/m.219536 type:complete len:213 (-) Transcript_70772:539-1177(-)
MSLIVPLAQPLTTSSAGSSAFAPPAARCGLPPRAECRSRLRLRLRLRLLLRLRLRLSRPCACCGPRSTTQPMCTSASSPRSSSTRSRRREGTRVITSTALPWRHSPATQTSTGRLASRRPSPKMRRFALVRLRYCGSGASFSSSFRLTAAGIRGMGVLKYFSFSSRPSMYSPMVVTGAAAISRPPWESVKLTLASSSRNSSKRSQSSSGGTT